MILEFQLLARVPFKHYVIIYGASQHIMQIQLFGNGIKVLTSNSFRKPNKKIIGQK